MNAFAEMNLAASVSENQSISLLMLDSHRLFTAGLESLIRGVDDISVVGCIQSPRELSASIGLFQVDVIVMGLDFENFDPFRSIPDWRKEHPGGRLLVLSGHDEEIYAERLIRAGASGYISKSSEFEDLLDAIRRVAKGELAVSPTIARHLLNNYTGNASSRDKNKDLSALTDRELQVLTLIAKGCSTVTIANQMSIGKKTVDTYKERIKSKLSIQTSMQLTQYAGRVIGISL